MPTPALDAKYATEKSGLLPARHVFVYGTLRKGEIRDINLLRPAPVWVGEGRVKGLLYDLAAYPGIVLQDEGSESAESSKEVFGEVYAISAELEQMLDEIEEVWPQQTGEYTKREVAVRLPGGVIPAEAAGLSDSSSGDFGQSAEPRLVCLLYEIAQQRTDGKPLIQGGDWVAHRLQV